MFYVSYLQENKEKSLLPCFQRLTVELINLILCIADKLHHKAKKYGLQNFTRVSKQEEFLCLPLHAVARYLADNQLAAACEEHVYEAALRWLEVGNALLLF